jgi:predicted dehydrogenase
VKVKQMYRVGIIGGETHIHEITNLRGHLLELIGISVRDDQHDWALDQFAVPVYASVTELLERAQPDIVAIANENDRKAEAVVQALDHGCHVIVDKPMALSLDEVQRIEAAGARAERHVLLLLTLRGDPWFATTRALVEAGTIGELVQVRMQMTVPLNASQRPDWFLDARRSGGPILDLAIHAFDALEWTTGRRLLWVAAHEANVSRPSQTTLVDSGAELFGLDNGGTAIVEQNRVGLEYDYRMAITGTAGQVNMLHKRQLRVQTADGWRDIPSPEMRTPVSVVHDWLESLGSGQRVPLISDADSLRASRVACLTRHAAETGVRVQIPGG